MVGCGLRNVVGIYERRARRLRIRPTYDYIIIIKVYIQTAVCGYIIMVYDYYSDINGREL